ncbi:MAG TPA: Rieske 2Fe-2S domain-containing protein [Acidimicrobiales bacterium]|nr:Rieske 2Fe-2S domain-containing protein [Acidimicrobiales bacterium]
MSELNDAPPASELNDAPPASALNDAPPASAFHDAAPTDWVAPGETATVEVDGRPVTLANVDGDYYAFPSQCPHQGTELGGLSLLRGRLLRCPEHGSTFDVTTGQCVLASEDGWTGILPLYGTRVVDDVVQVSLRPPA